MISQLIYNIPMFRTLIIIITVAYVIKRGRMQPSDEDVKIKRVLLKMQEEVTKDGWAKANAIMHMRRHYSDSTAYFAGKQTCSIRIKYWRMLFLYLKAYENSDIPIHILVDMMLEISDLAKYVDNLVTMISVMTREDMEKERLAKKEEERRKQSEEGKKKRWQVHQGNRGKVARQGDDDETNKYLNGFASDFDG